MSIDLLTKAVFHPMPSTMKAVLTILALHADDLGLCWPSVSTVKLKTGLGERTVRRAIADLVAEGWMTSQESAGGTNRYRLNCKRILTDPCHTGTPAAVAPLPDRQGGMPGRQGTPATQAGNRSVKDNERSEDKPTRAKPKNTGPLPDDWKPEPFGHGTKSERIMAGWDEDTLALQLEKFRAHHTARDNRFSSWQQTWSTWVLNSRIYHNGGSNGRHAQVHDRRDGFERAIDRSLGIDGPSGPDGPARPAGRQVAVAGPGHRPVGTPRLRAV